MSLKLEQVKADLDRCGVALPFVIEVSGNVSYCRIAKKIEGEELEKKNREAEVKGGIKHNGPYYQIVLNNPVIKDDGRPETNMAKNYLFQRIVNLMNNNTGKTEAKFFAESKSAFQPNVVYSVKAGANAGKAISDRDNPLQIDLASGLNVTIGMKFYPAKQGIRIGCGFDYVLVNEPEVRFYEPMTAVQAALAKDGVTYQSVQPAAQPAAVNTQQSYQAGPSYQPQQAQTGGFTPDSMNVPESIATWPETPLGQAGGTAQAGPFGTPTVQEPAPTQKQTAMPFGNPNQGLQPDTNIGVKYTPNQ